MADDDLTGTPVQRQGWASGGNYSLTPSSHKGGGKDKLDPQPVGGKKENTPAPVRRKRLDAQPVGGNNTPNVGGGAPVRRQGEGLQLAPVSEGGASTLPPVQPSVPRPVGEGEVTPPSVPSTQGDEWGEVNESEESLSLTSREENGEATSPSPSVSGEDEWADTDDEFTPGGEKESTPTSTDGDMQGDEWSDLDDEMPLPTPGDNNEGEVVSSPPLSDTTDEGEEDWDEGDEIVAPPRRKKKDSVYPPGFGSVTSPQEGSLLSPTSEGDNVSSPSVSGEDEWADTDDEFTPGGDEGEDSSTGEGKKRKGNAKPSSKVRNRVKPLVSASKDDGWDDDNPAMSKEGIKDEDELKSFISSSKNVRITERDIDIIRFLARYRYAQGVQVARYVDSSKRAIEQRLTKLGKAGLLRREDVTKGQSLWTPTGWGLSTADLDYTAIGAGKISYVTIAHTLGLVNLGIELENAGENVLELPEGDFPRSNKFGVNEDGVEDFVPGETIITEREIRQAEARWKKSFARIDIERAFRQALDEWKRNGDWTVPSPELDAGNEAMLVLWATKSGRSDHVPDMVVAGQRDSDGRSGNYAIELELTAKSIKEWERVLGTYADGRDVYSQVHYYTHKRTIADALLKVAETVGLREDEFFVHRYIPQQGNLPFWG